MIDSGEIRRSAASPGDLSVCAVDYDSEEQERRRSRLIVELDEHVVELYGEPSREGRLARAAMSFANATWSSGTSGRS